ncbi:AI-2E family transporter [Allohahella marinimesophila]|uniref:AI-2E family transporter n=1 Tax=Allohahella marinimesophila TaxID=1054972 RepID=A0ABP7P1R1_9GAMM
MKDTEMKEPANEVSTDPFIYRTWKAAFIFAATIIILAVLWYGYEVLLILFAGLLLSLFYLIPTKWLSRHTPLGHRSALAVVIVVLLGLFAAFGFSFASSVTQQFEQLSEIVPSSIAELRQQLSDLPLADQVINEVQEQQDNASSSQIGEWFSRISGVFSTTFGSLINFVIIFFIGLFVAFEPQTYRRMLIRLFPKRRRDYIADVLNALVDKLSWWMLGRIASMALVGLLIGLGLWALGMPMALSLGLLAALLEFIPNFGPMLAAIPALLVAYTQGEPQLVLHVAILYFVIQGMEGYVITPLIQRQAIEIPPAVLVAIQVSLGLYAGVLGLLLAAPMAAVLLVLVNKVYVSDYLGDSSGERKLSGKSDEEDGASNT